MTRERAIEILSSYPDDGDTTWDETIEACRMGAKALKREVQLDNKSIPKSLDVNKVVEWLENNLPNTYGFSVANKFKEDFGL